MTTNTKEYMVVEIAGKRVYLHRHIMECILEWPLAEDEVVHHKDGDRCNNDWCNLVVGKKAWHDRHHAEGGEKTMKIKHPTSAQRHEWLERAVEYMRAEFKEQFGDLPPVRVSVGYYYSGAAMTKGGCINPEATADGAYEILIAPNHGPEKMTGNPLEDARIEIGRTHDILDTIAHELIHAADKLEHGHKGPFRAMALAIGLEGKMTATTPGPEFKRRMGGFIEKHGIYPTGRITLNKVKRRVQGTRMLKLKCEGCGYVIRTTATWIGTGVPTCHCGMAFKEEKK